MLQYCYYLMQYCYLSKESENILHHWKIPSLTEPWDLETLLYFLS